MIWAYESLADREAHRNALEADRAWRSYVAEVMALNAIVSQEVMIVNAAPFSPSIATQRVDNRV